MPLPQLRIAYPQSLLRGQAQDADLPGVAVAVDVLGGLPTAVSG
ncbi:hypothetical protein SANTM175S_00512 [Streptomyces antimycoticus]